MKGQGRILPVLAVVLCLVLLTFGVASAITNGQPDGNGHPYVGAITFYDADSRPLPYCSGTLIAKQVVLTAGHCTSRAKSAKVSFDSIYNPVNLSSYDSTDVRTYEGFGSGSGNGLPGFITHDVGLVILSRPVTDEYSEESKTAELPQADAVSKLSMKSDVDLVGYGAQQVKPSMVLYPARFYAPAQFINDRGSLGDEFIKVTANPGQDKGGSCFGDSGGPVLKAGTDIILGLNSFGANANCAGVNYATRIDTPEVLSWIKANSPK